MTKDLQLAIEFEFDYAIILNYWQWFREQIIRHNQMQNLPITFSKQDGEISKNSRLDESDLYYEMASPEYNYTWHCQTINYKEAIHKLEITINEDDFGNYFSFAYKNSETPILDIKLFLSSKKKYISIHENNPKQELWLKSFEEFYKHLSKN